MREAELNRQRVVFTPQEAARLPQDRPYAAYICHYDWAEGEHATLMHCHERLAEVLLILKGSGRYTVDLRRYEVAAGDVVLCSGGALHDEFPQADQPYQTLCVAIGNLALADLPPYSLLSPDRCPLFHQPEEGGSRHPGGLHLRPCGQIHRPPLCGGPLHRAAGPPVLSESLSSVPYLPAEDGI